MHPINEALSKMGDRPQRVGKLQVAGSVKKAIGQAKEGDTVRFPGSLDQYSGKLQETVESGRFEQYLRSLPAPLTTGPRSTYDGECLTTAPSSYSDCQDRKRKAKATVMGDVAILQKKGGRQVWLAWLAAFD